MESRKKVTLYGIAIALSLLMIAVTAGASDQDIITTFEVVWQALWSLFLGIGAWYLIKIEYERGCKNPRYKWWTEKGEEND
jgi:hypothetical protein